MWRISRQLAWFGVGGAIGFIVDAGIVQLLVSKADANPYIARLFSFVCAATATWLFNRRYTFGDRGGHTLIGEWARYMAAMSLGFAMNYSTYALVIYYSAFVHDWPSIAVAAGSLPGSLVNFMTARHWVFPRRRAAAAAGLRRDAKNPV
ncbi:MAG: GtrA family protein [Rhodanobacteraceae bacterium]|nr:GtrA family protein [Pseudomonadota bacterium]